MTDPMPVFFGLNKAINNENSAFCGMEKLSENWLAVI
jgi:hypothetical protein